MSLPGIERIVSAITAILLSAVLATSATASPILFGIHCCYFAPDQNTSPGRLIKIDLNTSIPTLVGGPLGIIALGLAYNPNTHTAYTRDWNYLYEIDLLTGDLRLISRSGTFLTGLAFDPSFSTLYSMGQGDGNLYRINPITGETTGIGHTNISTPLDLAMSSNGQLLVTDDHGHIFDVNAATAVSHLMANIDFDGGLTAIEFDAQDNLFAVTLREDILLMDVLSSEGPSHIGNALHLSGFDDVRGLAFVDDGVQVPEPSTIALIGMALLSLLGFGMMRHLQAQ